MATFTGTEGDDTADAVTGTIIGFTGGSVSLLQDGIGDTFICDNGDDFVRAGLGDDLIQGDDGDDELYGGAGNDTIYAQTQADPGGFGISGFDKLHGGDGNDTIIGSFGTDHIFGDDGDDLLQGNIGDDLLVGGGGNDVIYGETVDFQSDPFANVALGGDGDDTLVGAAGDDEFYGQDGNDTLIGNGGLDRLRGNAGNDTYFVDQAGEVEENLDSGIDTVNAGLSYTLTANVEYLTLTGSGDINGTGNELGNWITGNHAVNQLSGLDGDDVLQGLSGADTLLGGDGNDAIYADSILFDFDSTANILRGQDGDDRLTGASGADRLNGGAGDDTLIGAGGVDRMAGGLGKDTYVVSDTGEVFEAAGEGIDTVEAQFSYRLDENVENLTLTSFFGTFTGIGNELANTITGSFGDDILRGLDGNDTVKGSLGRDTLNGGLGIDAADYSDKADSIVATAAGSSAHQVKVGGTAEDKILSIENLIGGSADDRLTGNDLKNVLTGNGGADTLRGLDGNDRLQGGAGADRLDGGLADDRFIYALLSDSGVGSGNRDVILGVAAGDKIDVSAIDAKEAVDGDQAFTLDNSFGAGDIRQRVESGDLVVDFNVDGDAIIEMQLLIAGQATRLGGEFFVL